MARAIELVGITKRFPGVVANDHVDLAVEEGEIHAICGENGAGKSTLMKILYGMQTPDEGVMKVFGNEVHFTTPTDAINLGIGMVHQHFMLAEQPHGARERDPRRRADAAGRPHRLRQGQEAPSRGRPRPTGSTSTPTS